MKHNIKRFTFIGQTFEEYTHMFNLTQDELENNTFLDCPGGACSFTAEAREKGIQAHAIDSEYGAPYLIFQTQCITEVEQLKLGFQDTSDSYNWSFYKNLQGLLQYRKQAALTFLRDYRTHPQHYIQGDLPHLNQPDNHVDIVLSGHFLCLYNDRLSLDFHRLAIKELLRIAKKEVRIYPLIGLDTQPYKHLPNIINALQNEGYTVTKETIAFAFLKGSNQFLKIKK